MTELGFVLLVLYLIEGLGWVSLRGVAISRRPWGGFSVRRARRLRQEGRRGVLLPEPWIPAFERHVVHPWPLAVSPKGVAGLEPGQGVVGWDNLGAARARGTALLLGSVKVDAGSPANARFFAGLLRRLAALPPTERETAIEGALRSSFDERQARRRSRIVNVLLRDARLLAFATTLNMLLAGPLAALFLGLARVWKSWLLMHLLLTVLTFMFVWTATRRKPQFATPDRFQMLMLLVLYPPAVARFVESVFPNAFAGLDPLAAQAALLHRTSLARVSLERIRWSYPTGRDHDIVRWFKDRVRREAEALADRMDLPCEPCWSRHATDSEATAFCPRCSARYRTETRYCADCPGVALVAPTEASPPTSACRPRHRSRPGRFM